MFMIRLPIAENILNEYATKQIVGPKYMFGPRRRFGMVPGEKDGGWVPGYEQNMKLPNFTLNFPGNSATVEYEYKLRQWDNQRATQLDLAVTSSASCDVVAFEKVNSTRRFRIPHTKFSQPNSTALYMQCRRANRVVDDNGVHNIELSQLFLEEISSFDQDSSFIHWVNFMGDFTTLPDPGPSCTWTCRLKFSSLDPRSEPR